MKVRQAALGILLTIVGSCFAPSAMTNVTREYLVEPQIVSPVSDMFYINMEIAVFEDQIATYPVTWANLEKALEEWARHLPIRWTLYKDTNAIFRTLSYRKHVIEIHLADLQSFTYGSSRPDLIGVWYPKYERIVLDADRLETNPAKAYAVSLHELGHMLGVPHVVGFDEQGLTGYLVLDVGINAQKFVMYPKSISKNPQKTLSPIEVMIAKHHLLTYWTKSHLTSKIQACELDNID